MIQICYLRLYLGIETVSCCRLQRMVRINYPGYQGFFLACDGELRFVGRKPTRLRPKTEDASEARVTF